MGISQLGGASSGRLMVKQNTAGQYLIGSLSLTATNGTTAYSQLTASLASESIVTQVYAVSGASSFDRGSQSYVDIAVGGSGSESSVGTTPIHNASSSSVTVNLAIGFLPVPSRIAAGQRVTVRLTAGSTLAGSQVTIYLWGVIYTNLEGN